MSIKNNLTKTARKILPKQAISGLEEIYRTSRAKAVALSYGNPTKDMRVIAVTGTNGKTTTVNLLNEILKEAGYKTAMFSTANIEIAGEQIRNDLNATVATVKRMYQFFKDAKEADVEFVLLEATSHALAQHKLDGINFEMAIMTNLTQDHLDYHKTMENYAAAKAKLFQTHPKYIILNSDDSWYDYFNKYEAEEKKITYGEKDADVKITDVKLYKKGSQAKIKAFGEEFEVATNLPGEFNVYNMAAAVSGGLLLGVSIEDIQEGIANLEGISGRFEIASQKSPFDVIVDYAHTPDALEKLLKTAHEISKGKVFLVFGACGDRDKEKRPIMGKIAQENADRIFITDEESYNENPDDIRAEIISGICDNPEDLPKNITEIPDRRSAIQSAMTEAKKGDLVLVTGMGHEVFRIINGEKIPWNDTQVIREIEDENL